MIASDGSLMEPTLIEPLGDCAFLAHFAGEGQARGWAAAVRSACVEGIRDIVLAYRSVAVFADGELVDLRELESRLVAVDVTALSQAAGRRLIIPVLYDGADLDDVAARLKVSIAQVIALHSSVDYDVFAIGFAPDGRHIRAELQRGPFHSAPGHRDHP